MDELQLIKLWNQARWQVIVSQLAPTALLAFAVAIIPVVSVDLVVSLIFLLILLASGILGAFAQYTASTEAQAIARMLRTSPQKLNLVAGLIRGKKVEKALADLTFSKRRIAGDVKKCLQSAIANAENNHGLDVDSLVVAEAWVGKNLVMKRGRPRARGRFGKIMKPFSEITIKVRQTGESA